MGQVNTSRGWMTSFIYEQDLTSYYMNNILTGMLHPGVYNANIALMQKGDVIYLLVKKGTTFLFSNSYFQKGGRTYRDFTNLGSSFSNESSSSDVIIKCVAQKDITQKLFDISVDTNFIDSNRRKNLYVFSYMKYESEPRNASGSNESAPQFFLVTSNDQLPNLNSPKDTNNYLYKTVFPVYSIEGTLENANFKVNSASSQYFVPDGCVSYSLDGSSRIIYDYNFLNIGAIIESSNNNDHITTADEWLKCHTFTAHGLPEYRYSMICESNAMQPDALLDMVGYSNNPIGSSLYIDLPDTLLGNMLFDERIDNSMGDLSWLRCYPNELRSIPLPSGIDLKSTLPNSQNDAYIVIDVIYGKYTSEVVEKKPDFSAFDDENIVFECTHLYESDIETKNLNYLTYNMSDWYSSANGVLPLDICEMNIKRLLPLVRNKQIWSSIIYDLRSKPNLNPNMSTSIIPIALAFRCFTKQNGKFESTYDKFTSQDSVNPVNMISYFDLARRMSKINALSTMKENIFNLIPILA